MLPSPLRAGLYLVTVAAVGSIMLSLYADTSGAAAVRPVRTAAAPSTFTAKPVPALTPDRSSAPATPLPGDKTVFGAVPAGTALSIPAGVIRPVRTNAWWSSGQFEQFPAPVYAWPLTATFGADGALLDAPGRRVQDKTVFSDARAPIRIFADVPVQSARAIVAGDFDVTFRATDATGQPLFDTTLIQGSPFAFIRSVKNRLTVALPQGTTAPLSCDGRCGSALSITTPKITYVLASPSRNAFTVQGGTVTVLLEGDHKFFTLIAVAPGSDPAAYLEASMRPYVRTGATFAVTDRAVETAYWFPVSTIIGVFPHQQSILKQNPGKLIGTIETLRGPVRLYLGKTLRVSLPRPSVIPSLPPSASAKTDTAFRQSLTAEVAANKQAAGDVYFAAKDLLRVATLAELADMTGDTALRTRAVTQARAQLAGWCTATPGKTAQYFAYDPAAGGVIAYPVGFGSEHYNDHHFHYGYFLHAAAIVQRFDPSFSREYGDCMRLLVRDIATTNRSDPSFPPLRSFDPYGGHSWAGGLTKFGDGTNQESTSEAVHAWYGMALYGRTTGDAELERLGTWMFAMEAHGARTYWLNAFPASGALPKNFPFSIISILWGGKADYATFFDGSDAAIRGIQFFPATAALLPMLDAQMVSRVVTPIIPATGNTIWKTALQLIAALYSPSAPLPADAPVDNAYSRAYLDEWMKSASQYGQPVASTAPCAGYVFKKGTVLTAGIYRFPQDAASCAFTLEGRAVTVDGLRAGWNVRVVR